MRDSLKQTFIEEATELLHDLETALMELEESANDPDLVNRIFRNLHTIKGSGAMVGFNNVAVLTHEVENYYDFVREGKVQMDRELVELTFAVCDQIRFMIANKDTVGDEEISEESKNLIKCFQDLIAAAEQNPSIGVNAHPSGETNVGRDTDSYSEATYRIRFGPPRHMFKHGTNPSFLFEDLRELGECSIVVNRANIPYLDQIDPESCYLSWDIILTTNKGPDAIRDVFIFIEDDCILRIDEIERPVQYDELDNSPLLGQILVDRGEAGPEEVIKNLKGPKRIGENLVDSGITDQEKIYSALVEQKHIRKVQRDRLSMDRVSSVRVPAHKLDALVDLVGELVTVQARLTQMAVNHDNPDLIQIAEEVERLTGELRDKTMSARTLPIGTIFSGLRRLVRDLSTELGKDISLAFEGAETELDKTVIEKLNDPLVHLIRNAIDHGIEDPATRERKGKPSTGTILLEAMPSGANVLVRISDDGNGLDADFIKERCLSKGIISPDVDLTKQEIFNLIFTPGFSTKDNVTNISGRGVGMDVVKKAIDSLRGSIEIDSTKGNGTAISVLLPLTLAIIDGLLVRMGEGLFVLPLSAVEECVELPHSEAVRTDRLKMINIRDEAVPYIRLRDVFSVKGRPPAIEQIVVARVEGNRVGFVVDVVLGDHQTVIKSLGNLFTGINEISGATVLGDGTLALIIDIPKLLTIINHDFKNDSTITNVTAMSTTIH